MTKEQLQHQLTSGRLSKPKIDVLVGELLEHPKLVTVLLDEVQLEDKRGTFNASWVLDHLLRKNLSYLLPYIEKFTSELENLKSESCIRPVAHICEMLCETYFVKQNLYFKNTITKVHLEHMVNACFNWLIGEHKMAAKVFAMTSLFYLGKEFKWIHPELEQVLENSISSGSTGYQHRAKRTLKALEASRQ
jgi:hypothetical protein